MRPTPDADRRFLFRVMLPMFGLIALLLGSTIAGLLLLAGKQNHMAIELQQQMAQNALRYFSGRVADIASDYGGRDETAEHVILDFDAVWLDEHLQTGRGEAFLFVLDPDDRTLFSRAGGRPDRIDALSVMPPTFRQMIVRWRAGSLSASITQMFAIDGEPYIVALSGIRAVASSGLAADNGYLLAIAYRFDPQSMHDLGETFVLPNLRYETGFGAGADDGGAGRIRLVAQDGTMGDSLVWDPIVPGDEIVRTAAPGLALAFAVYLVLAVVVLRFVSRAARMISISEEKALHDALTGLPNRLMLVERLQALLDPGGRREASILYLDLDGFKAINDLYGHAAGDAVLHAVARRLESLCRGQDMVARIGGDEFVMVLAAADRRAAEARGTTILSVLSAPCEHNGARLQVGVSVGVAVAPDDGIDVAGLLHKADDALYAAKQDGKGTVRFYRLSASPAGAAPLGCAAAG